MQRLVLVQLEYLCMQHALNPSPRSAALLLLREDVSVQHVAVMLLPYK